MTFKTLAAVAALTIVSAPSLAKEKEAPTATTTLQTKSGPIGEPEAGKGMIVFYRPGSLVGAALGCTVREGEGADEKQIARLGSGKYWVHQAEPGKHAYRTEGESKDSLNLEIEAGETYFVRCKIGAGFMSGSANLMPSDQAEFAKKAKGLKLWEPKGDLAEEKKSDKEKSKD